MRKKSGKKDSSMKKQKMKGMLFTLSIFTTLAISPCFVYAGEWKQDNVGRWYEENSTYQVNEWKLIDDQWYYFGNNGYMYANRTTPDGYWVDENGHSEPPTPVGPNGERTAEMLDGMELGGYNSGDWVNQEKVLAIGKEVQYSQGWERNPIMIWGPHLATFGGISGGGEVMAVWRHRGGYDISLKTRIKDDDWKKSFKALCMLTGIHDLYDILLDSWEGDEIYGINWDTPVTINGHTYSVVRNNGLNVYGSSGVTYSIRCAH